MNTITDRLVLDAQMQPFEMDINYPLLPNHVHQPVATLGLVALGIGLGAVAVSAFFAGANDAQAQIWH